MNTKKYPDNLKGHGERPHVRGFMGKVFFFFLKHSKRNCWNNNFPQRKLLKWMKCNENNAEQTSGHTQWPWLLLNRAQTGPAHWNTQDQFKQLWRFLGNKLGMERKSRFLIQTGPLIRLMVLSPGNWNLSWIKLTGQLIWWSIVWTTWINPFTCGLHT